MNHPIAVLFELAKSADLMICRGFFLHLGQGADSGTLFLHGTHSFGKLQLGRRLILGNDWLLSTGFGHITNQLKTFTGTTAALSKQRLMFG